MSLIIGAQRQIWNIASKFSHKFRYMQNVYAYKFQVENVNRCVLPADRSMCPPHTKKIHTFRSFIGSFSLDTFVAMNFLEQVSDQKIRRKERKKKRMEVTFHSEDSK